MSDRVTLAMGAGGKQTAELIDKVFAKRFESPLLTADDAAVLDRPAGRIAMSTDGFIVSPSFFAGGNIGKLSICGTVNDLACMGARPLYLTCAFVVEEGFELSKLEQIADSMVPAHLPGDYNQAVMDQNRRCEAGNRPPHSPCAAPAGANARPGDAIIVTGDVGRHGCTILLARDDFGIEANVTSDCAPLWSSVEAMLDASKSIHVIRDATRGGVGTVLYEIASQSGVGIALDAASIPVDPAVGGVCRMLGLEPLYLACEGRLVVIAPKDEAPALVEALRSAPHSQGATIIGEVTNERPGWVVMNTEVGTQTLLPQPGGELLPRIC